MKLSLRRFVLYNAKNNMAAVQNVHLAYTVTATANGPSR